MTYALGGPLGERTVAPGTNLLVRGPPFTGKRAFARASVARAAADDEGAIVISLRDAAGRVLTALDGPAARADADVAVVDCVSERFGRSGPESDAVRYASGPSDVTGIGVALTDLLESFSRERGRERNRVVLDSVTTLLEYATPRTTRSFLRAVTGRVAAVDGLGIYVVESTVHQEEVASIRDLFDGVIETARDGSTTATIADWDP